jgi:methyl-accepting chemotaxis protein
MNDICGITEKLSKVVTEIIKSMNDVAITVSDQANGVYQIEDKSKKIAEEILFIQKQINDSEQNAVALKELISKFKI